MQMLTAKAQQQANDSLQMIQPDNNRNTVDSTMIQQSIQRDDNDEPAATETSGQPAVQSTVPTVVSNAKPLIVKPGATKPILKPVQKPKAIMQNKNEY